MQELVREFGLFGKLDGVSQKVFNSFSIALKQQLDIVFLCVGTSRILGDCFGALVGDKLLGKNLPIFIYGNSKCCVDAKNISKTLKLISLVHPNSLIIVVDSLATTNASLVGDVLLSCEYVGLNKRVGLHADLFLYATTTYVGHQNLHAKLSIVEKLASVVSNTIENACLKALHFQEIEFLRECIC